ncbi:hypothetical protein GCM10023083_57410 [Streptomyces phyllanthi]
MLDIMEKRSLVRHEVDWARVRSDVFAQADGAQDPADTYGAIRVAVNLLHERTVARATTASPSAGRAAIRWPTVTRRSRC